MFIIKIAALAATVLFIISFTVIQILIASGSESDGKSCDYIIVLGCGINGRSMSLTGKSRADTAIEYMNAHPDCTAIICGGQGKREVITEAEAFYNYMSDNGIDKARMIKEEHSTDTSQNIRFAKKILEDIGADVNNDSFTVVTNEFHLYRSKLIMQKNGFKKVSGLSAPTPNVPFLKVNLYLREYFSVVFEYLNL